MRNKIFFTILFLGFRSVFSFGQQITDPQVLNYNYSIGTINIYPGYGFTCDDHLVEGAKLLLAQGANSIKIELGPGKGPFTSGNDPVPATYGVKATSDSDMVALVRDDSSFKKVLDMPFTYYFFWARTNNKWLDGYSATERQVDSLQFDAVTKYLLTHYNNSGKKFFFGNWEGDWLLRGSFSYFDSVPKPQQLNNMIQWINTRQNAIDAAKSAVVHSNVDVFHYLEGWTYDISWAGMGSLQTQKGTINDVLPYTHVDYYSYSSYGAQNLPQASYDSVLNYIESKLPAKPSITGKRVLIGELGQDKINWLGNNDSLYEAISRANIRKAIHWGTPFVWLWALYDGGFSYLDTANKKSDLFHTFTRFYQEGKKYVNGYKVANGFVPTQATYLAWADNFLSTHANFETPPENDNCTNAFLINGGTSCNPVIGDVAYATQSLPATSCGASIAGTANDDVWFKFVATSTSMAIKIKPDPGFDPVVDLFDGCGGNLIDCSSTSGNSAAIELINANNLTKGNTYYVRVYDWKATIPPTTTFSIYVYDIPVNDNCAGAISLNENTTCIPVQGTAINASQSFPANSCGASPAGSANDDVWFKFVAYASDATIKVVPDPGFDAVVDLFDACGGALLGCSSTSGNSNATEIINANNLTFGQTYYIRVYDWYPAIKPVNTFNICVYSPNSTTEVEEQVDEGISIFPNPTEGTFFIMGFQQGSDFSIYNLLGEKINSYRADAGILKISLNGKPEGIYLLKILSDKGIITKKIIVKK
jgi:hypothetical protein